MQRFILISTITLIAIIMIPLWVSLTDSQDSNSTTNVGSTVTFQTMWDWGSAEPLPDGVGWQMANDLGYTINVTDGYLVEYRVQLTECDHDHEHDEPETASLFDALSVATASAGHSVDGVAIGALETSRVTSLSNPQDNMWGELKIIDRLTFCGLHYLVARGATGTVNTIDTVDPFGISLMIEGTYIAPDSTEPVSFTAQTSHANGVISDLTVPYIQDENAHVHVKTGTQDAQVLLSRQLDQLFDGIDFAQLNEDELGMAVLWAYIDGISVSVEFGETFAEIDNSIELSDGE